MAVATTTRRPGSGCRAGVTIRRVPVTPVPVRRAARAPAATSRRRRVAAAVVGVVAVLGAAQAGGTLGGPPLAAPGRPPASVGYVVQPGDSLWSIAERLAPGEDPRPLVDALARARGNAPLRPGESIVWPG